jgi:hypothetical protein
LIFLRDRVDIAIIGAIFDLARMILTITSDVTADFTGGALALSLSAAAIAFSPDEHSNAINALPVLACMAVISPDLHFDGFHSVEQMFFQQRLINTILCSALSFVIAEGRFANFPGRRQI